MVEVLGGASLPIAAAMAFFVLCAVVLREGRGHAAFALAAFLGLRGVMALLPLWTAPSPDTLVARAWVATEAGVYGGVAVSLLLIAATYGTPPARASRLLAPVAIATVGAFVCVVLAWPHLYGLPRTPRGPLSLVQGVMFVAFAVGGLALLRRAEGASRSRRTALLLMAGAFVLTPGPDVGRTAYLLLSPPAGWALGTMALKAFVAGFLLVFTLEAIRMREGLLALLPPAACVIGLLATARTDSYLSVLTPTVRLAAAGIMAYAVLKGSLGERPKGRTALMLAGVAFGGWFGVQGLFEDLFGSIMAAVLLFIALGGRPGIDELLRALLPRNRP